MNIVSILLICCLWFIPGRAWSAGDWYWMSSGQLLLKQYSGSPLLEDLSGFGVLLSSDYLERGGLAVGYTYNRTNYGSDLSDTPQEIDEHILFLSGRVTFHPDLLPGGLTVRLDGYGANDAIRFRTTTSGAPNRGGGSAIQTSTIDDRIVVVSPMVSFLNYGKTLYADVGYGYSTYRSEDTTTDDLDVMQWTPTLGFGFNRGHDWLQVRAYLISLSASNRAGDFDTTSALEAKWTHWFAADAPLRVHSTRLIVLGGERMNAVDSDACSFFSVPDLQTAVIAIGVDWQLSERTTVLLQGGYEAYENVVLHDRYSSRYFYLSLSQNW